MIRLQNEKMQDEVDRIKRMNDDFSESAEHLRAKHAETLHEQEQIKQVLEGVKAELEAAKAENNAVSGELDVARESRKNNQRELGQQLQRYNEKSGEKKRLTSAYEDVAHEMERAESALRNARIVIQERENELRARGPSAEAEKLARENEILRSLVEKYKADAELHRELRESEKAKKREIEEEKRRAELDAMHKEMLARSVKKEADKMKQVEQYLEEDKGLIEQELEAIKGHAEVLETQNQEVWRCFFVRKNEPEKP